MEKAFELLGVKRLEDVLYVGDNDIDFVSADNAGIDAMLVKFAPRSLNMEEKFKYTITSFKEVLNYV